jgi:glucose-6-phosphate-specific signal transduction histidine kinase
MIDKVKSWFQDNHALVIFLIAQALAGFALGISIIAYMVRLETRVNTLEVRGSPHLAEINTRLTVLEGHTKDNKEAIDRIVEVMIRKLNINP